MPGQFMQIDAKLGHLLMVLLVVAVLMLMVVSAARGDHHLLRLIHIVTTARGCYVLLLPVGRKDADLNVVHALPSLA